MIYGLVYSKESLKQLKKFDKLIQKRIIFSLERCRIRPYSHIKKLVDSPYYRFRVGDYRVILDVVEGKLKILVVYIGHRKNVYKK